MPPPSRLRSLAVLVAAVLLLPRSLSPAQDRPDAGPVETVRVQLAQFDVVVRDKQGRIIPGLGKDDFEVLEDGKPLVVEAVDAWGQEPAKQTATPSAEPSPRPFADHCALPGEASATR